MCESRSSPRRKFDQKHTRDGPISPSRVSSEHRTRRQNAHLRPMTGSASGTSVRVRAPSSHRAPPAARGGSSSLCIEQEAVVVSEAPDNETAATLALAAVRSGCEPTCDRRSRRVRVLAYRWGACSSQTRRVTSQSSDTVHGRRLLRGVALAVSRRPVPGLDLAPWGRLAGEVADCPLLEGARGRRHWQPTSQLVRYVIVGHFEAGPRRGRRVAQV